MRFSPSPSGELLDAQGERRRLRVGGIPPNGRLEGGEHETAKNSVALRNDRRPKKRNTSPLHQIGRAPRRTRKNGKYPTQRFLSPTKGLRVTLKRTDANPRAIKDEFWSKPDWGTPFDRRSGFSSFLYFSDHLLISGQGFLLIAATGFPLSSRFPYFPWPFVIGISLGNFSGGIHSVRIFFREVRFRDFHGRGFGSNPPLPLSSSLFSQTVPFPSIPFVLTWARPLMGTFLIGKVGESGLLSKSLPALSLSGDPGYQTHHKKTERPEQR